jgi:hypothetical protein
MRVLSLLTLSSSCFILLILCKFPSLLIKSFHKIILYIVICNIFNCLGTLIGLPVDGSALCYMQVRSKSCMFYVYLADMFPFVIHIRSLLFLLLTLLCSHTLTSFSPSHFAIFTYSHFFFSFSLRYIHIRSLLFLLLTWLYSHTLTSFSPSPFVLFTYYFKGCLDKHFSIMYRILDYNSCVHSV